MVKPIMTLGFLFCVNFLFSQKRAVDTVAIRKDFEDLIGNLETNYVYFHKKDVDVASLKQYYSAQIKHLESEADITLFFEYLLDEFYDSHLHLNTNVKQSYRLYSPIFIRNLEDKNIISCVWKDQIWNTLKKDLVGSEILTLNGENFNDLIEKFPTYSQNKKNSEVRNWIANKVLSGRRSEPRIISFKTIAGKIDTIDIDKIRIKKETTSLNYKKIGDFGYIRINNSLGRYQTRWLFSQALRNLKNTKGLILDLRNTVDGGSTVVANPIAGHFINRKIPFQKYRNASQNFQDYIKPKKPYYDKPLVVLVGRWTGSMGEGLASGLDGAGIGKILGTEMEKLAGATKSYKFKNNSFGYQAPYIEVLRMNNEPREKFIPKYLIQCNCDDADEFISEAVKLLNQKSNL